MRYYYFFPIPNMRDKLLQLRSRHEAQQFSPGFQGNIAEFKKIRFMVKIVMIFVNVKEPTFSFVVQNLICSRATKPEFSNSCLE
jgi:hypothetical protein